ncbi:MAG: GNAT family N-acetyltransferase [Propionibacteriaceae bacterium]|jgi:ribosomal protein S18 acetylase RimI-like enzyme|nr:GNAT family N-acetyltransferase [Propionibacteriaceae bacterium]
MTSRTADQTQLDQSSGPVYRLRLATGSDWADIVALEMASFDHGRWSEQLWREEIAAADSDRGRLVSLIEQVTASTPIDSQSGPLVAVATWSWLDEVADLRRLSVHPDHRRAGLATRLLENGCQQASQAGVQRVLLEVSARNTAAISLYQRVGFTTIAVRPDYYGLGDDAWVMERSS